MLGLPLNNVRSSLKHKKNAVSVLMGPAACWLFEKRVLDSQKLLLKVFQGVLGGRFFKKAHLNK
jgi:hypothetical protein